jgi:hypothetical protein
MDMVLDKFTHAGYSLFEVVVQNLTIKSVPHVELHCNPVKPESQRVLIFCVSVTKPLVQNFYARRSNKDQKRFRITSFDGEGPLDVYIKKKVFPPFQLPVDFRLECSLEVPE